MNLYLFLSPHFDDAALSCGGLIKRLTSAGERVVVITIFTADLPPDVQLSRLARRNHLSWNAGHHPFAARAVEDEKAMRVLGAEYKRLGFLDAMYRRSENGSPFYQKRTVGVPVADADERQMISSLRMKFEELQNEFAGLDARVFSPLAIGGHVDHVLVRKSAEASWRFVYYYEDFPYAGREESARAGPALEGKESGWKCDSLELDSEEIASRVSAALEYTSQIRGLFPSFRERIFEIAQAHIGYLSAFHFPENRGAGYRRAENSIRKYIEKAGGERYWFTGEEEDSLPVATRRD